ncbi:hypothetical protein O1611_g4369 [Lasiodiplodia mahajangana]|uniref:Uncharacterized protein n=1 Tax=Lasiodiplodia mahajangana TaxID=1108764 RepID=A0ACC2JP35_9PEZI|nr:hypothetical protein O1611_g4369 [Lasiodiplodia mahajangana]
MRARARTNSIRTSRLSTHIGELRQVSLSWGHSQVLAYLARQGGTRGAREYQRASHVCGEQADGGEVKEEKKKRVVEMENGGEKFYGLVEQGRYRARIGALGVASFSLQLPYIFLVYLPSNTRPEIACCFACNAMGIRGLSAAVRHYGKFSPLSGDTVVIDGPALVYQVLDGCMRRRPSTNGFICQPSYSTLGRMVIGWLEELQRHNVIVRKIYFDGYLPPSKWQVRQKRLLEQSENMKRLLASHPLGSSRLPEGAFEAIKAEIALTRSVGHSSHSNWIPKPPFLVPAVIEILKNCRTWGPLVEVVSGEADVFCAEDIRRHGGVLLTSDSDLLITELGLNGRVSFFTDVVVANQSDESQGLMACKFSLHAINDTLGISNVGGLGRVAFEKVKCRTSFNDAVKRAKDSNDTSLKSSEFQTFMEEYSMKEYLPRDHPVQRILSGLDPRISEIVIQTLLFDGTGAVLGNADNSRGPETLAMFLPVMIENRDRKSAWTMSTAVRQLAYGIMQTFAIDRSPLVIEYRLLETSNSLIGRQIDVLGLEETLEQCRLLIDTTKQLAARVPRTDIQWLAFAIYQDIMWSTSEQRPPLSALIIHKAKHDLEDAGDYSWDTIHFAAQVQASLYSLRMAKHILDVSASLLPALPPPMQELRECLSTLPTIAEWPTVENISQVLAAAGEAGTLSIITDILGMPAIEDPGNLLDTSQRKKRRVKNGFLRSERDPERPVSVNPFAVLSHAS